MWRASSVQSVLHSHLWPAALIVNRLFTVPQTGDLHCSNSALHTAEAQQSFCIQQHMHSPEYSKWSYLTAQLICFPSTHIHQWSDSSPGECSGGCCYWSMLHNIQLQIYLEIRVFCHMSGGTQKFNQSELSSYFRNTHIPWRAALMCMYGQGWEEDMKYFRFCGRPGTPPVAMK